MKLFRALLRVTALLSVVCLTGCHRPSVDGEFVSTRGGVTVTLKNGSFASTNGTFSGTYATSGHDITLTGVTGIKYEGFLPDNDSIFINRENGQESPGFSLSRVGSRAANETLAIHGVSQQAQTAPPPDAFKPDPSVPLSAYSAIASQTDAGMVLIPWSNKSLADDELLRQFTTGLSSSDAFKRQEIAQQELPKLHGRMKEALNQRYYTIDINRNNTRDDFVFSQLLLRPYDLSTKSFGLSSLGQDCWRAHEINMARIPYGFLIEQSAKACQLSVPDETTARQIEDLRARSLLNVGGTIGICITRQGTGNGRVFVALTYAHIVLTTSRGPAFKFEMDL